MEVLFGSWMLVPLVLIALHAVSHPNGASMHVLRRWVVAVFPVATMLCFLLLHFSGVVQTGAAVAGYGVGSFVFFSGCVMAAFGLLHVADVGLVSVSSVWVGSVGGDGYVIALIGIALGFVILRATSLGQVAVGHPVATDRVSAHPAG